jgi:H+/Cl- antiporter ClcA
MTQRSFLFKPAIYVALAAYITLSYFVLAMGNNWVVLTIPEDHYFELIGALAFLATSILFFYCFILTRRTREKNWISLIRQAIFLGLAALFFFGAGEEISWGQRILGFETPESLSQVNRQEEFNLHNLSAWEASEFLDPDRLFDIFWFLLAVVVPAVSLVVPSFRRLAGKFIPIVFWGIGLLFVYNYLWAKLAKVAFDTVYAYERISFNQAIQEIKESNYAIVFILVGLYALWDMKQS